MTLAYEEVPGSHFRIKASASSMHREILESEKLSRGGVETALDEGEEWRDKENDGVLG